MEFLDARRLTGPSLLFDRHGSVLDVACTDAEADRLEAAWRTHVRRMLDAVGWGDAELAAARVTGGMSLGFTAPVDALYAASAISEWAWAACDSELNGAEAQDFDAAVASIRAAIADEANPALVALEGAAAARDVTFLWDDDLASLGLGRYSGTWPVRELPGPAVLDWPTYRDIPCGLVTGTNGKTTTVRLAARILHAAGHKVGLSSTDCIAIDGEVVDRDDWSGPGGARAVLRDTRVDAAILETARGGLLRRGLGVVRADVAVITNVARDHLGDFGSRSLDELLEIKWIVSRAVLEAGTLVLNADDALLCARAASYPGRIAWFSLDPGNEVVREHTVGGGVAFVLDDTELLRIEGDRRSCICEAGDISITLGGIARHNTANALAAAAMAECMGATPADVRDGLESMTQADNPGRCNVYRAGGVTVIVDFAHNPQAIAATLGMASALERRRTALCFAQAGDRPDDLIRELARDAWRTGLDRVYVSELAHYHRGREYGDVYGLIRDELIRCGAGPDQIEHHDEEVESLDAALAWAGPGDVVVMLALERSPQLQERLSSLSTQPES